MRYENGESKGIFTVIKGTALALGLSVFSAIVFACILRATGWSDTVVYPVNQVIKSLAVAIGAMAFVRGEKGWIKGGGIGLLFTALSYLAFSAIGGDFSFSWLIFLELFLAFLTGAIGGILAVNWKK